MLLEAMNIEIHMYFLLEMCNKRGHKMRTGYLKKMKYAFTSYFIRPFTIHIFDIYSIHSGKEIGDEEPHCSTKISILSFIWAGLAALHNARYSKMMVVQS